VSLTLVFGTWFWTGCIKDIVPLLKILVQEETTCFGIQEDGDSRTALSLLDLISAEMTLHVKRPFGVKPCHFEKLLSDVCTKKIDGSLVDTCYSLFPLILQNSTAMLLVVTSNRAQVFYSIIWLFLTIEMSYLCFLRSSWTPLIESFDQGLDHFLIRGLIRGIDVHHAGLSAIYRQVVEILFRAHLRVSNC
jgi:hypothetical protein